MNDLWALLPFAGALLAIVLPACLLMFKSINHWRGYTIFQRKKALVVSLCAGIGLTFLVSVTANIFIWSDFSDGGFLGLVGFAVNLSLATMLLVGPIVWLTMFIFSFVPFFFASAQESRS